MKKYFNCLSIIKSLLVLFVILLSSYVSAQSTFTKQYGGNYDSEGSHITSTSDGGMVVTGYLDTTWFYQNKDVLLYKTDDNGTLQWMKQYGDSSSQSGSFAKQLSDNGFLITGTTDGFSWQHRDLILIRTDANGNLLWSKKYGTHADEFGIYAEEISNGFLVFAEIDTIYDYGLLMIKTDNAGDIVWSKRITGFIPQSVIHTSNNKYFVSGYSNSNSYTTVLVKFDENGNVIWSYKIDNQNSYNASACETSDGGFAICGAIQEQDSLYSNLFIMRTDSAGIIQWTKSIGGPFNEAIKGSANIISTQDSGIVAAGSSWGNGSAGWKGYLIKFNLNGTLLWSRQLGYWNNDHCNSIAEKGNGQLITTGFTNIFEPYDAFIYKLNSEGNETCYDSVAVFDSYHSISFSQIPYAVTVESFPLDTFHQVLTQRNFSGEQTLCLVEGISFPESEESISIYPNPATDKLIIETLNGAKSKSISIIDAMGREIVQLNSTKPKTFVNISRLSAGLYFVKVIQLDGEIQLKKLVVTH